MELYEYRFLKTYHGITDNQYDFILPEYKTPTESWPLHELKLTFDKNVPKRISTLLLPTNEIIDRKIHQISISNIGEKKENVKWKLLTQRATRKN